MNRPPMELHEATYLKRPSPRTSCVILLAVLFVVMLATTPTKRSYKRQTPPSSVLMTKPAPDDLGAEYIPVLTGGVGSATPMGFR